MRCLCPTDLAAVTSESRASQSFWNTSIIKFKASHPGTFILQLAARDDQVEVVASLLVLTGRYRAHSSTQTSFMICEVCRVTYEHLKRLLRDDWWHKCQKLWSPQSIFLTSNKTFTRHLWKGRCAKIIVFQFRTIKLYVLRTANQQNKSIDTIWRVITRDTTTLMPAVHARIWQFCEFCVCTTVKLVAVTPSSRKTCWVVFQTTEHLWKNSK